MKPNLSLFAAGILLVLGADAGFAQPITLINNLNAPGPGGGVIGDIETVVPGAGFAVGLLTPSTTAYQVDSVTLEFIGNSLPSAGLSIQIYSFGPPGSVTPPGWPFVPAGALGNPTINPQPTQWPGQTTYVTYTPTSPITLAPSFGYWIGVSEAANGNDNNGLLFALSQTYTVGGGAQVYSSNTGWNQWELDPNTGQWIMASPNGYEGLKFELTATPIPEPAGLSLLGGCILMLCRRGMKPSIR